MHCMHILWFSFVHDGHFRKETGEAVAIKPYKSWGALDKAMWLDS